MRSEVFNVVGIILLASGAFTGLSVHAIHIGVHHADHTHTTEIAMGIVMLVLGVLLLVWNNQPEK
jgi:hypothetical protein